MGLGVQQNYKKAAEWYQLPSRRGRPDAQFHLGSLYKQGLGVVQNYDLALKWLTKAANYKHAPAQASVGEMYRDGLGVEKDNIKSFMWFELAANNSKAKEQTRYLASRDELTKKMTSSQINEAKRLAAEWKPVN